MRSIVAGLFITLQISAFAHEGMWVPTLLASIEDEMQSEGLLLSAEDIYSVNNGSLKDAVVHFGGGCTSEIISKEGLLLTNHHCGYGQIQSHSSLENDYLMNGFWAMDRSQELMNPGLTATFIIRIEDVTKEMLAAQGDGSDEASMEAAMEKVMKELTDAAVKDSHHEAFIRPFNYGNAYYMIVTETFKDVRLVGAPPSSIGKYGADTDNWVWPRHTGDFSIFRIYAGADGKPAEPSADNVPFKPRHSLPVNIAGLEDGDFAMIYGFPGRTMRYLPSKAVKHVIDVQNPMRITMREASLSVIDAAMRNSDKVRIQYAAKQSRISNAYKKWIGQSRGLKWLDAVQKKVDMEEEFAERVRSKGLESTHGQLLASLNEAYESYLPHADARDLFIEFVYYGPEIIRFADRFRGLVEKREELEESGKWAAEKEKVLGGLKGFYKDYDMEVDKQVFIKHLPLVIHFMDDELEPSSFKTLNLKFKGDVEAYVDDLYERSVLGSEEDLNKLLEGSSKNLAKSMLKDPIYVMKKELFDMYFGKVRAGYSEGSAAVDKEMREWTSALAELFPERNFWPDANSTLRLSYGKVEGSQPSDAVTYEPFTSLSGVIEKYIPGNYEFDLPEKLLELYEAKDYGPYGEDGRMPVCFTSSLHTTGGNSGSPIINANGELIGLNFDRSWESTMSDILFDPEKCRNISVDIRYVLFIIDKFAGAGHLVSEMEVVTERPGKSEAVPAIEEDTVEAG